jgi:probable HAF family extracellular repeat protein
MIGKVRLAYLAFALAYLTLIQTPVVADALFHVTDLNFMTSPSPYAAVGLNNSGQVIGELPLGANWQQGYAFVYDGSPGSSGAVTPLGGSVAPTGFPPVRDSTPTAINDLGQVAGVGGPDPYAPPLGAYIYSNGQTTQIPVYPIFGFNNSGQIASYVNGSQPNSLEGIVYNTSNGSTQVLPALPGAYQVFPTAINNLGQVVGNTFFGNSGSFSAGATSGYWGHPFLVSGGKAIDLGSLGGTNANATAINDSGQVVGWSSLTNNLFTHAFLYANGKMVDLGTLPGFAGSQATSINAQGQIVGNAYMANGSSFNAFLYSNGVMTNLNSLIDPKSGWTIEFAQSINNLGQILALAYNDTTESEVLLTPTNLAAPGDPQYVTITPEPGSIAVFGLIVAALSARLGIVKRFRRCPTARPVLQESGNRSSLIRP